MKLSDTHLILLSAAAKRADHSLELPADLEPAAAEKLVSKLAGAGLIEEIEAGEMPVWRRVDDVAFALRITDVGLKAIGVDESSPTSATEEDVASPAPARRKKKAAGPTPQIAKVRKPRVRLPKRTMSKAPRAAKARKSAQPKVSRSGTKLDEVRNLLLRKRGATIKEMMDATSWLPHTTRAVLTGFRKCGFGVEREAVKDKPSVYRIVRAAGKPGTRAASAA